MTQDVAVKEAPVQAADAQYDELEGGFWTPPVDIREDDDAVHLRAALPGARREDIGLELREGVLVLTGRVAGAAADGWLRKELPHGRFYRAFSLPDGVKSAEVQAKYAEGVLEVRLPKSEEAKPHKVRID